ncbi:helix-turn-helix domain-containing protein [Actinoallomurus sp. CA-150999]|uniref:helix-turn-helix domain-containing protein n=1 Tax=Actinoallomurus sp. CA-150999 TaxID=3239887 RepID=UPI003D8E83C1
MLTDLGGTPDEDAAYRYLITVPSATAATIATELDRPVPAVTVALAALARRGLVTSAGADPVRHVAAPPTIAGQVLLNQQREALVRAEAGLAELVKAYRQGSALRAVTEVVEVIKEPDAVRQRVTGMLRGARREMLALVAPPFLAITVDDEDAQIPVRVSGANRTVYDRRIFETPGALESARTYAHAEDEWRVHDRVPMKLIIVDRELAVLSTVYAETGPPGTMLVHRSTLLEALLGFYELIWSQSVPLSLGLAVTPADSPLSDEERLVLSLLLTGMTDQAIAVHLGVGHRSVQRTVRRLMDLAEVGTRIQLGWHAHRYGWLGPA